MKGHSVEESGELLGICERNEFEWCELNMLEGLEKVADFIDQQWMEKRVVN